MFRKLSFAGIALKTGVELYNDEEDAYSNANADSGASQNSPCHDVPEEEKDSPFRELSMKN